MITITITGQTNNYICSDLSPQSPSLAGLVVARQLVVFQVEAPVHVVNTVRDLVSIRHHPQVERFRIRDDWLSDSIHTQIVATEPVSAVVGLFILAVSTRYEKVVRHTSLTVFSSLHCPTVLGVVVEVGAVGQREGARLQ